MRRDVARRVGALFVLALCSVLLATSGDIVVTAQLLDYESGYVFFTTGDGFRVAPNIVIRDAKTGGPTKLQPAPRLWARATFDSAGTVTELDLSKTKLPQEGNLADVVKRFAIALSSPVPNPDLIAATPAPGTTLAPPQETFSGRPVIVTFNVEVPPQTPFTASVYITTDASGWNPQAIPMSRIDANHFSITRRLNSGTIFRYLYDRGSFQQVEIAENGLQRDPRRILVTDADVRVVRDTVYGWVDLTPGGQAQQPTTLPTPYNPAPFPNLPPGAGPPGGFGPPHPGRTPVPSSNRS
ncbi:MAG TPA: CBM20 domain-containing protein [Candidatus Acidoferrales bacterium]|nr:CBM20 domain-containing protein [Candidatus Acidoferrales bacterium]